MRLRPYAELGEECIDDPDTVAEGQTIVGHHSLDLVELRQVGRIQRLVTEHAV